MTSILFQARSKAIEVRAGHLRVNVSGGSRQVQAGQVLPFVVPAARTLDSLPAAGNLPVSNRVQACRCGTEHYKASLWISGRSGHRGSAANESAGLE